MKLLSFLRKPEQPESKTEPASFLSITKSEKKEDPAIKNMQYDIKQHRKDFTKELNNMRAMVTNEFETVNKRIAETNLAIDKASLKGQKELKDDINNLAEQLVEIRSVMTLLQNKISELERMSNRITDLGNNIGGYKRSVNKKVQAMQTVVTESQEKVDKFDDTYKSMVSTIHKRIRKS